MQDEYGEKVVNAKVLTKWFDKFEFPSGGTFSVKLLEE